MIDESSVASANLEFNRERIEREAQDLADECGCDIEAWTRDDDGERNSHTGITVKPDARTSKIRAGRCRHYDLGRT